MCGIVIIVLFIFERFLTCKYWKYISGSYNVSSF